jgi:hypothetical protein
MDNKYLVIPNCAVTFEDNGMTVKNIDGFFSCPEFQDKLEAVKFILHTDFDCDLYEQL